MHTLIVAPGNGPHNASLNDEAAEKYADWNVIGLRWGHWDGEPFDVRREVEKLAAALKEHPDALLLAKSLGCLVAFQALQQAPAKRAVLMGTNVREGDDLRIYLPTGTPLHFIQNEHDPFGESKLLEHALAGTHEVHIIKGKMDHDYDVPDENVLVGE